eukprot:6448957-Amphidinium_carterae.1
MQVTLSRVASAYENLGVYGTNSRPAEKLLEKKVYHTGVTCFTEFREAPGANKSALTAYTTELLGERSGPQ